MKNYCVNIDELSKKYELSERMAKLLNKVADLCLLIRDDNSSRCKFMFKFDTILDKVSFPDDAGVKNIYVKEDLYRILVILEREKLIEVRRGFYSEK